MKGGLVWFAAGIIVCLIIVNDEVGGATNTMAGVIVQLTTFVTGVLTGLHPIAAALVVLGLGLVMGRNMSERARGRKDAKDAWNRRNAYRK